jgi:uncharacterized DUF497 family protein
LPSTLEFDWDENNRRHIKKHGVEPAEAKQALANDPLELEALYQEDEERFPAVGLTLRPLARCRRNDARAEGTGRHCV